jgi:hypothetical protein
MPNPEIIATLNAAVDVNNSKLFGAMFRQEVSHFHLYSKNNEKELSDLIEYVKVNYPEKYFKASIQSLTDFLFTHQVLDDNGESELQLNSFCQSLMFSGKIKDRIQLFKEIDKISTTEIFYNNIDKEISIRRNLAIVTFVCLLGFVSRKACQQAIERWYFRQTCRQGRNLYHSIESYAENMSAMHILNGGKEPTFLNFWFVFIFRIVVWGLLTFGLFKLITFVFK